MLPKSGPKISQKCRSDSQHNLLMFHKSIKSFILLKHTMLWAPIRLLNWQLSCSRNVISNVALKGFGQQNIALPPGASVSRQIFASLIISIEFPPVPSSTKPAAQFQLSAVQCFRDRRKQQQCNLLSSALQQPFQSGDLTSRAEIFSKFRLLFWLLFIEKPCRATDNNFGEMRSWLQVWNLALSRGMKKFPIHGQLAWSCTRAQHKESGIGWFQTLDLIILRNDSYVGWNWVWDQTSGQV